MPIFKDNQQGIYLKKGDTGNIGISGIPTDKSYSVYMSIYNEDTNTILKEILMSNYNQPEGTGSFIIDTTISDSLPVGEWVYAIKICASGSEDTIIPKTRVEDGVIVNYPAPKFTVDYKYVEGE